MRRKVEIATLGNLLRLFSSRLAEFKGESKRSYQKAFSSFQIYLVGNYSMTTMFESHVVENWVVANILQGLSRNTVSFYLEKISSLYSGIAHKLEGGKTDVFKEVKKKFKSLEYDLNSGVKYRNISLKVRNFNSSQLKKHKKCLLAQALKDYSLPGKVNEKDSLKDIWLSVALYSGVLPNVVKGIIGGSTKGNRILDLCESKEVSEEERHEAANSVERCIQGEDLQWFAMRLRPKVNFQGILERFAQISEIVSLPELFYPCDEIAKKVGGKIVWKGKPLIRDVVFFKSRKSEIYPLFSRLYDLAWCYRTPGGTGGDYAVIPDKAMENFRNAIGFLSSDFEVTPLGEMKLKPGDKVVIVEGEYANELAQVLKQPSRKDMENMIYRVSLLNSNGHWDIGIDARLLKKV